MRPTRLLLALTSVCLAGCAFPLKRADGGRSYLVLGVGWIRQPAPHPPGDTEAVRLHSLGLAVANGPQTQVVVGLGAIQSASTTMPPDGVLINNTGRTLSIIPAPSAPPPSTP